jgi:hypothetical protein
MYETDEYEDYEYWKSKHNAHTTLRKGCSLHNKCMNLLYLPKITHQYFK